MMPEIQNSLFTVANVQTFIVSLNILPYRAYVLSCHILCYTEMYQFRIRKTMRAPTMQHRCNIFSSYISDS
jgi:hypothetical protein